MISVGMAVYPRINVPQNLKGGDTTINSQIIDILLENGINVETIPFDMKLLKIPATLQKIFLLPFIKEIIIPIIYSLIINKFFLNYDILICDSGVCYNIKHPRCINLFHYSYSGYKKEIGNKNFLMRIYIIYSFLAWIQKKGAKKTINIAVSEYLKNVLSEQGIFVNRIIWNSINLELFKKQPLIKKNNSLLYTGGYSYYGKGFDILEELAARGLSIDCVTNIHKGKGLNWFNSIEHNKMPELYNQYQILIYPSRFESCQMVPLEAMACGLPVLISNVGIGPNLKKIIPEFVIDGYDNQAIDEYIEKYDQILNNYSEFSLKARKYVEDFHSFHQFKKDWLEVVHEVLNKKVIDSELID